MIKTKFCAISLVVMGFIAVLNGTCALGETLSVTVDKALDGDTLRLSDGRMVRYIGIDAPEIDHRHHSADPFGYEAYQFNARCVDQKTIILQFDHERKDHYDRLLAYVFTSKGVLINQALLEKGLASVMYNHMNIHYFNVLLDAQRAAMQQRLGIWHQSKKGQGPYLGNVRSKRFHLKWCPDGQHISEKNLVVFKDLYEAYWQGFAPCAHCLPSAIRKLQQKRRRK